MVGPDNAEKYQTLVFLAGSASAEVIADVALAPFETIKVRVWMGAGVSPSAMRQPSPPQEVA